MENPETTVPPVAKAQAQNVCASDPNFAVIFAFCERFGDSCGVVIPTFQELQEMLEKTNEVPDVLVDLHIKLLRRVKKSVHVDKWEKAILKFCQVYSIPDFWELERFGYKGISVQLKLRILKTLFEAQFDSNVKFKAEINKLESSTLRSQPLGWDKSGIAYWVQFDRASNLRVYKEDTDEDKWKIVANDRNTLVSLINDLSGVKDNTHDDIEDSNSNGIDSDADVELSPGLDQEKLSPTISNIATIENNKIKHSINESNVDLEKNNINLKRKLNEEDNSVNKINVPIVGEVIEESVMIVKGEGSGQECDTGNPEETNTNNETSKNEDLKKPKLWSIEAICSSSKDVQEENISVPTTGFFFGDDSVPCLNVSNGEKLEADTSNVKEEVVNTFDELDSTIISHNVKSLNDESSAKNKEEFFNKNTLKQSVFNIKVDEKEVQITERNANDVFIKPESSIKNDIHKTDVLEPISHDTYIEPQEPQLNKTTRIFEINKEDNQCDETYKYNTDSNIYENEIIDEHKISSINTEVECKKVEDDQKLINNSDSFDIDIDNQKVEQNNLSITLNEDIEDETGQEHTTNTHVHTIKTNTNILDDKMQIIKQSINQIHQCDDENESVVSMANQCSDFNEQKKVGIVEQNVCTLDKTVSNIVDIDVTTNSVLTNVCNVIDKNKTIIKSVPKGTETDKQVSQHFSEHTQTNDYLETNATCLKDDINPERDNLTLNAIDCNSVAHDQIITEDVNQCFKTSKQIDGDQNDKKCKKTSHNIRNIIETDEVVNIDSVKANEQSINTISDSKDIIQLENCKINKNDKSCKYNVLHEENQSVMDVDNVSDNKSNLDKISKISNENKKILKSSEKETTKKVNLEDNTESSNVESEMDKINNKEKSETNIKELKIKNMDISNDLTVVNKDKKEIELAIPSIQTQKKNIIMIDKIPKYPMFKDELATNSMKQYSEDKITQEKLKVHYTEIKPIAEGITINKSKKGKQKLIKAKSKTKVCYEEKLNLGKSENTLDNKQNEIRSITEAPMKIDKDNFDETIENDKNVTDKLIKTDKKLEHEEEKLNVDTDNKNQKSKIKEIKIEYILDSEKETITSQVNEDIHENADEINEETSSKEEFDNSGVMDHTIKEDTKKSEEVEGIQKKRGRPGRKKGKRGRAKISITIKQGSNIEEKVKRPYKPRQKKVVTIAEEEVTLIPEPAGEENIRRSRRIAEIKIKEQFIPTTHYDDDIDIPLKGSKKKDKGGKKGSTPSKKIVTADESDDEDEEDPICKKFKKKKKKGKPDSLKKLNTKNPWNVDSESSSSENNIGLFEDYDHEEEDEIPRPGIEPNISDHEFSPESDINDDDEEYLPEKRARTAHKKDELLKDDMSCKKCNKSDQPEWILLCDTCNQGWHASCLRPALMVIPDGDWYCPHCRHKSLLDALNDTLKKYDGESKKRENEELRRKRLAYVGISLQNVIASKTEDVKTDKQLVVNDSSEDDEEESESDSYDSEPLYQLRARRKTNVSYRFNDYDDMIDEAILETGVDESVIKKSAEVKTDRNDNDEESDSDNEGIGREKQDSPIAPALLHLRGRKKSKKLTNLDVSSDDGSDEDFKGPSDGDDDYDEDLSEYSDDSVKRPQPTRRSVRNRKTVVDPDFINDDSSEDSDQRSKKKRTKRPWSDSSNSEEEDFTWGKKKKKRINAPSTSSSYKQSKESKRKHGENNRKSKKSKIKYGMDSDSNSDDQPKRRTRGRQITYAESDDSEVEVKTKKRKVASDDEDEYVLNDEELEAENEDHNLELDDEEDDPVVSNEENDEEVVEEEEDDPKPKETSITQKFAATLPSAVTQSVIKQPTNIASVSSSSPVIDLIQDKNVHQRLLPSAVEGAVQTSNQSPPQLSVGRSDKCKRLPHQQKKSPSPNPSMDCSDSYPYPPDASKVDSVVPPASIHVAFNKPAGAATDGFKLLTANVQSSLSPDGFSATPTPYRGANKIAAAPTVAVPTPPGYLPPQVQQVYQAPLSANYSPYPIDYVAPGAPMPQPPPPPAIPFRNVVVAPPLSHDTSVPVQTHQQSAIGSVAGSGDSEFGGLVSYFSSQQEDDFDT